MKEKENKMIRVYSSKRKMTLDAVGKCHLLRLWKKYEVPTAKFKTGDKIIITNAGFFPEKYNGRKDIILAANDTGEGVEYILRYYPFLIYETRIKEEEYEGHRKMGKGQIPVS